MRRSPAELHAMEHDDLVTYCLTLQNLLAEDVDDFDEQTMNVKEYLANMRRKVRSGDVTRDDLLAAALRVGEDASDHKDRLKALELARKTLVDMDNAEGEEDDDFDDILASDRPDNLIPITGGD